MNTFFITGLPRSRTSWLANFMTHGPSFCAHDAMKDGLTVDAVARTFLSAQRTMNVGSVGDSDSALCSVATELVAMYPKARWVFIIRDPAEAEHSYRKFFYAADPYLPKEADIHAIFEECWYRLREAMETVENKIVLEFQQLEEMRTLENIWSYCTHGEPFNYERARLLQTLQVNPFPGKTVVTRPPGERQLRPTSHNIPVQLAILADKKGLIA